MVGPRPRPVLAGGATSIRFEKALAEPESVDSSGNTYSTLPYGAEDTAAIAARLDQWAVRHRQPGKFVGGDHPDAPGAGLRPAADERA